MNSITQKELKQALIHTCDLIVLSEPMLTELDTIIGDGDHGYGMKDGFGELKKTLVRADYPDVFELLKASGLELVKTMGGASGVIFGTLLTGGLSTITHKEFMQAKDIVTFFDESAKTIARRGRTKPGDKTMLDALLSAVEAMKLTVKQTDRIEDVLSDAYQGALQGVEDTKSMTPRIGRSKNFREQAIGLPDPGAVSTSIIFKGLYEGISKDIESRTKK